MKTELNTNELEVFNAIVEAHNNSGGDFCYAYELETKLSKNQIKGYLGQLTKKGFIMVCEEYDQINFLKKSLEIQKDLEDYCNIY